MVPAPFSKLTSTVAAAVDVQRKPALVARLALWQRRPAGVLCVELADLQLAPVAVYVEQQHALQLAEYLGGLSGSFEAAAAAAAAAAAGHDSGGGEGSSQAGSEASFHQAAVAAGAAAVMAHGSSSLGAVASVAARLPGLHPDLEVGGWAGGWLGGMHLPLPLLHSSSTMSTACTSQDTQQLLPLLSPCPASPSAGAAEWAGPAGASGAEGVY